MMLALPSMTRRMRRYERHRRALEAAGEQLDGEDAEPPQAFPENRVMPAASRAERREAAGMCASAARGGASILLPGLGMLTARATGIGLAPSTQALACVQRRAPLKAVMTASDVGPRVQGRGTSSLPIIDST